MSVHAESAERTGRSGVRKAERAEDRAAAVAGLDLLRAVGWLVLHDVAVPGEVEVPIDHVLAGPSGVYVINRISAPGAIKMTEDSLVVGGVSAYDHVEDIAAAALALREALDGRPVVPILCFQLPDEVAGVVAKVAICSTENILELLNGQPTVLDAAAAREVMHKVGGTLERRSVARPMAAVVELPVDKPRHREKAKGRKRLLGFGRSDDDKNAAIVELTVAPMIERRREVARADDSQVEAESAAVEAAQVEAERVQAERVAAERVAADEAARLAADEAAQVEAERLAAQEVERLEAERVQAERLAAEEAARIEAEGLAADEAARLAAKEAARVEAERLAAEEAARVAARRQVAEEAARVEAERLAAAEAARLAADEAARVEAERLEAEEAARVEAERLAVEEAARVEAERLAAEEVARLAAEEAARVEAERLAAEEAARLAAEEAARVEAEQLAAEEAARLAAEEAARAEAERLAAEEAARVEAERQAAEEAVRLAAAEVARAEAERLAAEKAARIEAERLAAEKAARIEAERLAAEAAAQAEADRLAAEEVERLAAEEAARVEVEQLAAEEAARAEAERLAAEEAARVAAERLAVEEAERAEAEWAAADEAAWAEAERIAAERLAARKAQRVEPEYVDEPESFETVAAQPPQEPEEQPQEPIAAPAARPVVRQTRGHDQDDERPSAPPVGPAARRVDVKSAVKMVSAAFARRDDDLEFDLNELETAFKEETPERDVPAWFGGSTPAAAKPAAVPVTDEPAKKRRVSLMPAIVGALVVAVIFGVAPRLSDAYEWGRSFFVEPAPPSLGETAVIAQTGSHPAVQVMAGIPLNVKSANGVTAAKGQHLVGVPVQVMSQGNVKWTLPVAGGFKAVDTLGITHSPATKVTKVTAGKVLPKRLQLTPGKTVTGMVVFAVANGRDIGIVEVTLANGEVASVWNAPEAD